MSATETDPFAWFQRWMTEAEASEPVDPNAMTVATVGPNGRPSARIVLLKGADPRGFVFYTNTQSRKGDELRGYAPAALLFHWKSLRRQSGSRAPSRPSRPPRPTPTTPPAPASPASAPGPPTSPARCPSAPSWSAA